MSIELSEGSLELFVALVDDAGNWSGTPCYGGNVGGGKKENGHLTDLKKKDLLVTFQDEDNRSIQWVYFTPAGQEYARSIADAHNLSKVCIESLGIYTKKKEG